MCTLPPCCFPAAELRPHFLKVMQQVVYSISSEVATDLLLDTDCAYSTSIRPIQPFVATYDVY